MKVDIITALTDILGVTVLIMASILVRRSCVRPGGTLHRHVKRNIRNHHQEKKSSSESNQKGNERQDQHHHREDSNYYLHQQKALLQYSGFLVFCFVLLAIIIFNVVLQRPNIQVGMIVLAILMLNGIDEKTQSWQTKQDDVLGFRNQLRKSFLSPAKDEESDSSESYDPEKHDDFATK